MNIEIVACFSKEESDWNNLSIEEMDSLAKTDQLLMEHKVKTVDSTSPYRHYYHFKRPRK